jgi:hypothetical protein
MRGIVSRRKNKIIAFTLKVKRILKNRKTGIQMHRNLSGGHNSFIYIPSIRSFMSSGSEVTLPT